jgi:DNA-directed RNA polymerase subunit RPC12/RpoP
MENPFEDIFGMINKAKAEDLPKTEIKKDICTKCGGEFIQMMDRKKCDTCGRIVEDING